MWPFKKKDNKIEDLAYERLSILTNKRIDISREIRESESLKDNKKRAYLGTYKEPKLEPRINFWESEYPNEDYSCLPEYATEYFMERRQAMSRSGLL